MIWKVLMDAYHGTTKCSAEEQAYSKVQLLCACFFEQAFFTVLQVYILGREQFLGRTVVTMGSVVPALGSACLNMYQAWDYAKTYSKLTTGGNFSDFKNILFSLGVVAVLRCMFHVMGVRQRLRASCKPCASCTCTVSVSNSASRPSTQYCRGACDLQCAGSSMA